MALLDLPTEILQHIIDEARPEGFESLMLTRKPLHHCGQRFTTDHRALKKRWGHIMFDCNDYFFSDPLQLLYEIACEPRISRYIKHANFRDFWFPWDDGWGAFDGFFDEWLADPVISHTIVEFLQHSWYLKKARISHKKIFERIIQEITDERADGSGSMTYTLAILLTLMPNVKTLQLPRDYKQTSLAARHEPDILPDLVIRTVVEGCKPFASLSQLSALHPSLDSGESTPFDPRVVVPFLSLPLVREWCVCGYDTSDTAGRQRVFDRAHYSTFGRAIEVIEMKSCFIGEQHFRQLVLNMPRLKSFELHCEDNLYFARRSAASHWSWLLASITAKWPLDKV